MKLDDEAEEAISLITAVGSLIAVLLLVASIGAPFVLL